MLEVVQSTVTISLVWFLTSRVGLVGAALAWVPAILLSQGLSAWFLLSILDQPFRGLLAPFMAVLTATMLCVVVATIAIYFVPGVVGLIIAAALGIMSTMAFLWFADYRYELGFADDLALVFPQFAAFLRSASIKNR